MLGNKVFVSFVQFLKTLSAIMANPSAKTTSLRFVQLIKAPSCKLLKLEGKVTFSKSSLSANASLPISVTLLGIFTFSKLLTFLFGKARHTSYFMIVGLSLGSIVSMFCNGDIITTYLAWAENGVYVFDLILGIALFAVGVVGAYLLVRYQRKKDAENASAQ